MAVGPGTYRLKIDITYNNTSGANTALSSINNYLATQSDVSQTATRSGSNVFLQIDGLTETRATELKAALTPLWGQGTRTGGKFSVVRRTEDA